MGASAFLKSVDFTAFAVNVKTITLGKYLYQFGHAIWFGDTPMAVHSFLESYDFTGKKIIPFCTSGSSSPQTSYESVRASVIGAEVLEGFWIQGTSAGKAQDDVNREMLLDGPLTIHMSDYGEMEKVGPLGKNLPVNDKNIRKSDDTMKHMAVWNKYVF